MVDIQTKNIHLYLYDELYYELLGQLRENDPLMPAPSLTVERCCGPDKIRTHIFSPNIPTPNHSPARPVQSLVLLIHSSASICKATRKYWLFMTSHLFVQILLGEGVGVQS